MGPSGLLDNDLHALRALRPCDPRNEDFCFLRLVFFSSSEFVSYFSGRFDTSGYILPLLVPEISPGDGFCDEEDVQELGILGVRFAVIGMSMIFSQCFEF